MTQLSAFGKIVLSNFSRHRALCGVFSTFDLSEKTDNFATHQRLRYDVDNSSRKREVISFYAYSRCHENRQDVTAFVFAHRVCYIIPLAAGGPYP